MCGADSVIKIFFFYGSSQGLGIVHFYQLCNNSVHNDDLESPRKSQSMFFLRCTPLPLSSLEKVAL